MKTNELRVGNYIRFKSDNSIEKVEDIQTHDNICTPINRVDISDVEPIPLTEEWLIKFGFEKSGLYLVKDQVYLYESFEDFDCFVEYRFNYTKVLVKHVHQVQNLFYSLTQTELTISE